VATAKKGLEYRNRLGLVGPAVSDHPYLEELLVKLREAGARFAISSMRVSNVSDAILKEIVAGGAKTLTLAPEAGSQRMRDVIRKGISEDDIMKTMERVAHQEINQLKLYFMIGLPSETDEDIAEIISLTLRCKDILEREQRGTRISLNVSAFVPKAGTPFQWLPMAPVQTVKKRLSLLKNSLSPKGIKIKSESPSWSLVQGVLSRGDARIAEVLANMEDTSLASWNKAMAGCGLDTASCVCQAFDVTKNLPWSMIDTGIKPGKLKRELHDSLAVTKEIIQ